MKRINLIISFGVVQMLAAGSWADEATYCAKKTKIHTYQVQKKLKSLPIYKPTNAFTLSNSKMFLTSAPNKVNCISEQGKLTGFYKPPMGYKFSVAPVLLEKEGLLAVSVYDEKFGKAKLIYLDSDCKIAQSKELEDQMYLTSLTLSDEGNLIAANRSGKIEIYDGAGNTPYDLDSYTYGKGPLTVVPLPQTSSPTGKKGNVLVFSKDGKMTRMAAPYQYNPKEIMQWKMNDSRLVVVGQRMGQPVATPDGRVVFFTHARSENEIHLNFLDSMGNLKSQPLKFSDDIDVSKLVALPDGSVFFGTNKGVAMVVSEEGKIRAKVKMNAPIVATSPVLLENGNVAFATDNGEVSVLNPDAVVGNNANAAIVSKYQVKGKVHHLVANRDGFIAMHDGLEEGASGKDGVEFLHTEKSGSMLAQVINQSGDCEGAGVNEEAEYADSTMKYVSKTPKPVDYIAEPSSDQKDSKDVQ